MAIVVLDDIIKNYPADTILKGIANEYKMRMKARRQLREVDTWLHAMKEITTKKESLIQPSPIGLMSPLYTASVVRYAGWFKKVSGKYVLLANEYFQERSKLLDEHRHLMTLRDTVLAHPEDELSGGDEFFVELDASGVAKKVTSTFEIQMADNINVFHDCLIHVHNRLDAIIIPELELKLLARIKRNEVRKSRRQ